MDAELAQALDEAEEVRFWQGARADYARLRADLAAWADYIGELTEWDRIAGDGLDSE